MWSRFSGLQAECSHVYCRNFLYNPDLKEGVLVDFGLAEVGGMFWVVVKIRTLTSTPVVYSARVPSTLARVSAPIKAMSAVAGY